MDGPQGKTGRDVYYDVVHHVLKNGQPRIARDRRTLDAGFTSILLDTPFDALPLGTGRHLNPAIAAAEALQLIGGFSNAGLMQRISVRFADFLDGDTFYGAYGSRIKTHVQNAVSKLRQDEGSRQAVVTL